MAQYAVPTSDISKTDWGQFQGNNDANAFDELDEGIASADGDTTSWQSSSGNVVNQGGVVEAVRIEAATGTGTLDLTIQVYGYFL